MGDQDGIVKSAEWASGICDFPTDAIIDLAKRMGTQKTMISIAWSLNRQDHGEQPYWAAIALAALLGGIGLPGTGIGFGYSAENATDTSRRQIKIAAFPQEKNNVTSFIPAPRIADMLENPGGTFGYNGGQHTYPDTHLIW
ncbi:molybdopterin-dependent oxidoreductase [Lentibacter algarum]|uniref:molybdopterin-dependent oxidoreductase n=1 Tax=Lentibacter algarum TaxID=576131 RepID=UPI001C091D99|nr:molybdopterin-dependent oxidoreductase [Lentibacter algarum]MBU2983664.1 molybdopterin-dependent oxidoreductase [Lentibacter algarum]